MFNLFKKQFVDESLEDQKADVLKLQFLENSSKEFSEKVLSGESCDELKNATGDFGKIATNPIPVNGPIGEVKYLNRLRSSDGCGFIFHRIGSIEQPGITGNVDVFEIVSVDGKTWDILYLHFYHPRRSVKCPTDYHFSEFHKIYSRIPFAYGTTQTDRDFPFGIGKFIEIMNVADMGKTFARKFEKEIEDKRKFVRPEKHNQKLALAIQLMEHTKHKYKDDKTILTNEDVARLNFYFQNNKFEEAERFLRMKNMQKPNDSGVIYHLGYLCRLMGNYDEALKFYLHAMKLSPFDSSVFFGLGVVYQQKGEYNSAIQAFEKAISLDPNFSQALNSLALTYKKEGNFEKSLKYYNQSIEVLFQNIYDEIKRKPLKEIDNRYAEINSEKWREVATQIAMKNGAKDGIKNVRLPTGETALKSLEENPFMGVALHDDNGTRYILPAYFSAFYNSLKSNLLYSTILNNIGTLFAENGDKEQAQKCYMESIEFTPHGVSFNDPVIGLRKIND